MQGFGAKQDEISWYTSDLVQNWYKPCWDNKFSKFEIIILIIFFIFDISRFSSKISDPGVGWGSDIWSCFSLAPSTELCCANFCEVYCTWTEQANTELSNAPKIIGIRELSRILGWKMYGSRMSDLGRLRFLSCKNTSRFAMPYMIAISDIPNLISDSHTFFNLKFLIILEFQ